MVCFQELVGKLVVVAAAAQADHKTGKVIVEGKTATVQAVAVVECYLLVQLAEGPAVHLVVMIVGLMQTEQ